MSCFNIQNSTFFCAESNSISINQNINEKKENSEISLLALEKLSDIKSTTRDENWYELKLKEKNRSPLNYVEKETIEKAIEESLKKTPIKINRTVEDFLKHNKDENKKFRILTLGSGDIHKNRDAIEKLSHYTIDIEESCNPDLVASINDSVALSSFPNESFNRIVWEHVPSPALLNTEHFDQIHRILSKDGEAHLCIPLNIARLIPFLLQETAFKDQIPYDYCSDDLHLVYSDPNYNDRAQAATTDFEDNLCQKILKK